jgi:hypothetical protein
MPRLKILTSFCPRERPEMDDDILDSLILEGMVEPAGIDSSTGEILYAFTDKAIKEMPNLGRELEEAFYAVLMALWEAGFLMMDIASENPMVTATEKALDPDEVAKLPEGQQKTLAIILEALRL